MAPSHSFHALDDFEVVWERLKKIARREGKSAGVLIREFVIRYVDIHDPGNLQAASPATPKAVLLMSPLLRVV